MSFAYNKVGSLDAAVALLLEWSPPSAAAAPAAPPLTAPRASSTASRVSVVAPPAADDDLERIKRSIVAGYMLQEVHLNEDTRTTKPTLPKEVKATTVRYREGVRRGRRDRDRMEGILDNMQALTLWDAASGVDERRAVCG